MGEQKGKQMRVPPQLEAGLRRARPAAFAHSTAHGILTLACEAAGLARPQTPSERKALGGAAATGQLKNPHARKTKKRKR